MSNVVPKSPRLARLARPFFSSSRGDLVSFAGSPRGACARSGVVACLRRPPSLLAASLSVVASVVVAGCASSDWGGQGASASAPSEPFVIITPEEAALSQASQAITARVGHLVTYDVDADVVKEYSPRFYEYLTDALARVALGVDAARTRDPESAARACMIMSKLRIELDEKTREPYARFEPRTGSLVLRAPTRATALTSESAVSAALTAIE